MSMIRSLWQWLKQTTLLAIYPDYFQQHATYFLGDQDQEYCVQLQDTENILETYHRVAWRSPAGTHLIHNY